MNRSCRVVQAKRARGELSAVRPWQPVAAGLFRKALLALVPGAFRTARVPDTRAEPPAFSGSNPFAAPNRSAAWSRSRRRYARPESMPAAPSYFHLLTGRRPNRPRLETRARLFRWACPARRLHWAFLIELL